MSVKIGEQDVHDEEEFWVTLFKCPSCKECAITPNLYGYKFKFCPMCGVALEWEGVYYGG